MGFPLFSTHNVLLVNITLTPTCLSTGSDSDNGNGSYYTSYRYSNNYGHHHHHDASLITKCAQFISQVCGMDMVILNQLMHSIKTTNGHFRNGHVQRIETKDCWPYTQSILKEEWHHHR